MMLNVKFAASTWLWTSPFSTESMALFPKIKALGFDGVEIPVEDPEIIDTALVRKALVDHGLQPLVCGAFGPSRDLTHEDPGIREGALHYILKCLDICNELGADFFTGPMYSAVGKARLLSDEDRKKEFDLAAENLHQACNLAQSRNLKLAIEPLNRFETDLINTTRDLKKLLEQIGHPCAKAALDSFHMTIEESNLHEAVMEVKNDLIHVQVSENHRGVPGTGQTQWKKLKKGLEEINYEGFISIESFTPEVKELAGAVCIWRQFAESQDEFARKGLEFLKQWSQMN